MNKEYIMRGLFYAFITIVAALAGMYVKRVFIGQGEFILSTMDIVTMLVTACGVGILVPGIEKRKKK